MSGPKLSEAELERLRQEQLERERQEALRRLQEAQRAYRNECEKIESLKRSASILSGQLDGDLHSEFEYKINQIFSDLKPVTVSNNKEPESYYNAIQQMEAKLQSGKIKLDEQMKAALNRAKNDKSLGEAGASYQSFQAAVSELDKEIQVVKIDFSSNFDEDVVTKQVTAMIEHFTVMSVKTSDEVLVSFSKRAIKALEDIKMQGITDDNIDKSRRIMQNIINEEQEQIRLYKEKKTLYENYASLAAMTDAQLLEQSAFKDTEAIKKEIERLSNIFRKQDEMDYIADQINEAMVELGYTFVSSSILVNKDNGDTDFSLYKADEQTGIAIYTDQSGAVMMRMTVLGDDPTISEADRDFSYQRQIDFCAGHPDIIKALAARGVYLKQKSYLEPDKKHTFKMSATGTQSTSKSGGASRDDAGKQKVERRRRRRAGTKKMRAL